MMLCVLAIELLNMTQKPRFESQVTCQLPLPGQLGHRSHRTKLFFVLFLYTVFPPLSDN